jgi:hypothetical protein
MFARWLILGALTPSSRLTAGTWKSPANQAPVSIEQAMNSDGSVRRINSDFEDSGFGARPFPSF